MLHEASVKCYVNRLLLLFYLSLFSLCSDSTSDKRVGSFHKKENGVLSPPAELWCVITRRDDLVLIILFFAPWRNMFLSLYGHSFSQFLFVPGVLPSGGEAHVLWSPVFLMKSSVLLAPCFGSLSFCMTNLLPSSLDVFLIKLAEKCFGTLQNSFCCSHHQYILMSLFQKQPWTPKPWHYRHHTVMISCLV